MLIWSAQKLRALLPSLLLTSICKTSCLTQQPQLSSHIFLTTQKKPWPGNPYLWHCFHCFASVFHSRFSLGTIYSHLLRTLGFDTWLISLHCDIQSLNEAHFKNNIDRVSMCRNRTMWPTCLVNECTTLSRHLQPPTPPNSPPHTHTHICSEAAGRWNWWISCNSELVDMETIWSVVKIF